MSVIGEGFSIFANAKEWKKDYEKAHDKDLYIHRIEDLLSKAEKECKRLNDLNITLEEKIKKLETPNLTVNENHLQILKFLYENEDIPEKEFMDHIGKDMITNKCFMELFKNEYIIMKEDEFASVSRGIVKRYKINEDKKIEVIDLFIKNDMNDLKNKKWEKEQVVGRITRMR